MRPDKDTRLVSMGKSEATCEKCMMELYPGGSDDVCMDCQLNPINSSDDFGRFIDKTVSRENSFDLDELLQRHRKMNS